MRLNVLLSFVGFVLIIAGTYCPILRPLHLFNWDVYAANKPFGIVILLIAVVGIISTVFNQVSVTRFTAWASLGLVILFYIAALFKVHTSFSFIPFPSIDAFLTRQIKFKWGWYLLFGGACTAVFGVLFTRKSNFKIG